MTAEEPKAAEYQELGRFISDFTMLERALHTLCAALVVPRGAEEGAHSRAMAVAAEVDSSRLCQSLIKRLIANSPYDEVQQLADEWKRLSSTVVTEIDWRNEVAHSAWSLTLADGGLELRKHRRGQETTVDLALIGRHRSAVGRLTLAVFQMAVVAHPDTYVEVRVERGARAEG